MNDYANEYGKALHYSGNSSRVTEADFHDSIDDDVSEKVNHGAYADWLDEQGKPAHAELVRLASDSVSTPNPRIVGGVWRNFNTWEPKERSEVWYYPDVRKVLLRIRMAHNPHGNLEFHARNIDPDDAIRLVKGVREEGGARNTRYDPEE